MIEQVATTTVGIAFAAFGPAQVDVVAGDEVVWRNDSARAHTIVAEDGRFDLGRIPPGATARLRFTAPGVVAYHCSLHAGMDGEVVVNELMLDPLAGTAAPGRAFPVGGRSSLPTGTPVALQVDGVTLAQTAVDADGTFSASITPGASGALRAVAGDVTSPERPLLVLDRQVSATARRLSRRTVEVRVRVTPASAGAPVVVQARIPERFGWWPVARARLGAGSTATLRVALRRRLPLRAVLTLPDFATELARSAATASAAPPGTTTSSVPRPRHGSSPPRSAGSAGRGPGTE